MREETLEFILNWEKKSSELETNDLNGVYNKFVTLFTIYNRYYNEVYFNLKNQNLLAKSRYSDFDKATNIVVDYLGAESIINRINDNNNSKEIDAICTLIDNKVFHINLVNGEPNELIDLELLQNLRSQNIDIKVKAIFSVIYNVRCNLIHGHKDFQEYQRLIVEPLIILIIDILSLLKEKM